MKTNRDIEELNRELSLVGKLAEQIAQLALVSYEDVQVELEHNFTHRYQIASNIQGVGNTEEFFWVVVYPKTAMASSTYRMLGEQILTKCPELRNCRIEFFVDDHADYIVKVIGGHRKDEYINWKEA